MNHISEIFDEKDISFVDCDYNEFVKARTKFLSDRSRENYIVMISLYAGVDSDLRAALSSGYLTLEQIVLIRNELWKGL